MNEGVAVASWLDGGRRQTNEQQIQPIKVLNAMKIPCSVMSLHKAVGRCTKLHGRGLGMSVIGLLPFTYVASRCRGSGAPGGIHRHRCFLTLIAAFLITVWADASLALQRCRHAAWRRRPGYTLADKVPCWSVCPGQRMQSKVDYSIPRGILR